MLTVKYLRLFYRVDLSDQLSVTQTAAVPKTAPKHK